MTTASQAPHAEIMRMLHAPLLTQALAVVAELGIADLVASGPQPVEDLAEKTGADPDALYRVLRALAGSGVFSEVSPRVFGSTPLAETMQEGTEGTLRNWARLWGISERQAAIGALLHSVRTGEPAFARLHGTSWWSHLAARPDQAAVFDAAMGDLSRELHAATVDAYDLSAARRLVDVGGGRGHLVAALLGKYRGMRAVVLDQPGVARHAAKVLADAGVADRAHVVAGDFFTAVPADGDTYLLSMILHDWDDEKAVRILGNVRRAMGPGSELLVVDAIVPEGNSHHDGKVRDLIMLALHPGRERTEAEFATLFEQAGLRLRETREVAASTGLLVAVPARPLCRPFGDGGADPPGHIVAAGEPRRAAAARPDGLRAALQQDQFLIEGKLDVLRATLFAFDLLAQAGQREHLVTGQAWLGPPGRIDGDGGSSGGPVLDALVAGRVPDHREAHFVDDPSIRGHLAADHRQAEAPARLDHDP